MPRLRRNNDVLNHPNRWWHRLKISTQKFAILLTLAAFAMGFGYVWMTNTTAATGFTIEELQDDIATLKEQNEKLELRAADLRALTAIQVSSQSLELEPADSFDVLGAIDGSVAIQR